MNILIVDNDPVFLKFVEKILLDRGHAVHTAPDGLSALDALKTFNPDLFFIDYVMPNIDGRLFCKLIKNNPEFASSLVVLLSAVAAEEWTNLKKVGADICIAKGQLDKMKGHILHVIDHPEESAEYCASGEVIGIEDVFPRRITKELLASKKHFQLLLERMSEGILELNADSRIVFANPAALKLLKTSERSIIGLSLLEIFPDEQKKRVASHLDGSDQATRPEADTALLHIDDESFTLNILTLRSELKHSLVILNDISAYKQAEDRLRKTNEFLTSILNSAYSISIISTDLNQNILFWNQGAEEIFGYSAEEVIGKKKIDILYPGNREKRLAEEIRQMLQHEKREVSCELSEVTKDGKELWMNLHLSPRFDEEGEVIGILGIGEDITERKAAEENLRDSEKRYRSVVENLGAGMLVAMDRKLVFANEAIARFVGTSPEELLQAQDPFDFIHAEDREIVLDRHLRRLKGETVPDRNTFRVVSKDGGIKWVEVTSSLIDWYETPAVLSFYSNVTKRVTAMIALEKSEARYRQIFNIAPAGIYEIDFRTGKLVNVNDAISDFTGYTREELLSMNPVGLLDEESQVLFINRLDKISKGEAVPETVEYRAVRKDGTSFMISLDANYLYEGDTVVGATVVASDVTDRIVTEEALRESEEKYRSVLEASQDPIVVYDMKGNVTYFNPAFTRVFGWSLEERLGKKMDFFVPEEAWPETEIMIKKVMKGESFSGFITKRYDKEGNIIHVNMSTSYQRDAAGNPIGSVINLRDISEQRRLESQLRQAQKMESLGTLAGGVAHDFNNLLMGIQGRASLMIMDTDSSHPHFGHLKGIEDHVQSAAMLTKQLLGFARGGKYEVKAVDLNEFVRNESAMFGRTRKDVTIHEKYEEALWAVEIDQGQIEQVLLNIFVNAWQAMSGGGNLYIQSENSVVDETLSGIYESDPGRYVKISITDTGIGMDEATLERIFDPFFTTKEIGRGTGLGLASAYGIIQNHGGFIDVASKKREGSTFAIYLPASAKETVRELKPEESIFKGDETILLVDDEDLILDVGQNILEILGYNVLVSKNGNKAIDIFTDKVTKIDMVILDMIMPGMDGGELYDRLKDIDPGVKVLLSSGYSVNGQATEIMKKGCNGFIQKPFNMGDLSKKIREVLDAE